MKFKDLEVLENLKLEKNYENAHELLDKIIPENPDALLDKADLYFDAGDVENGLKCHRLWLELNEDE